jgi:hypothetical protein
MSTHTVYEHAIDSLRGASREVGKRIPTEVPVSLNDIEWPEDLVARVTEDLAESFDTVKTVVTPVAGVAVGAGASVAATIGQTVRRHPVLAAAGIGVAIALVIWMLRRTSTSDSALAAGHPERVSQVA